MTLLSMQQLHNQAYSCNVSDAYYVVLNKNVCICQSYFYVNNENNTINESCYPGCFVSPTFKNQKHQVGCDCLFNQLANPSVLCVFASQRG